MRIYIISIMILFALNSTFSQTTINYTYNQQNMITSFSHGNYTQEYSYDESGNRLLTSNSILLTASEMELDSELSFWPNPFTSEINISYSKNEIIQSVELLNILGEQVLIRNNINGSFYTLKTDDLIVGTYFIRVHTNVKSYVKKLIKIDM